MHASIQYKKVCTRITGIFFIVIIFLSACQKKYLQPVVSYGTNFNLLLKMVVNSDAGVTTHTFSYDENNALVTRNILLKGKNPSRTENTVEQYYRNAAGTVDSIKITSSLNGAVNSIKKMYFVYSSGSRVSYSIVVYNINDPNTIRDSSTYQYTGNFLIQRSDFTATGSNAYNTTPSRQLTFQYSGTNISNLIFLNGATTTLVSYTYDTSKAALPINGFQYIYSSVGFAYQEYAAVNNLKTAKYGDAASIEGSSYSYSYLPMGKPYNADLTETDATGGTVSSKIEFYYD